MRYALVMFLTLGFLSKAEAESLRNIGETLKPLQVFEQEAEAKKKEEEKACYKMVRVVERKDADKPDSEYRQLPGGSTYTSYLAADLKARFGNKILDVHLLWTPWTHGEVAEGISMESLKLIKNTLFCKLILERNSGKPWKAEGWKKVWSKWQTFQPDQIYTFYSKIQDKQFRIRAQFSQEKNGSKCGSVVPPKEDQKIPLPVF